MKIESDAVSVAFPLSAQRCVRISWKPGPLQQRQAESRAGLSAKCGVGFGVISDGEGAGVDDGSGRTGEVGGDCGENGRDELKV